MALRSRRRRWDLVSFGREPETGQRRGARHLDRSNGFRQAVRSDLETAAMGVATCSSDRNPLSRISDTVSVLRTDGASDIPFGTLRSKRKTVGWACFRGVRIARLSAKPNPRAGVGADHASPGFGRDSALIVSGGGVLGGGAVPLLRKPFTGDDLLTRVETALHE
jgi:hypothetical protein